MVILLRDQWSGGAGTFTINGTHARAVNDRWAYKISAGGYSSDAFARPTGFIPGTQTEYPNYQNEGTTQPKFDARVDYDYPDGRKLTFSGGVSGTEGIMHSGIGPFDIDQGTITSGQIWINPRAFGRPPSELRGDRQQLAA